MIHLNIAFLVIRPTLNTIVKILINASPFVVNKYTMITDFSVYVLLQYGGWNVRHALQACSYIPSTGMITQVNSWNFEG